MLWLLNYGKRLLFTGKIWYDMKFVLALGDVYGRTASLVRYGWSSVTADILGVLGGSFSNTATGASAAGTAALSHISEFGEGVGGFWAEQSKITDDFVAAAGRNASRLASKIKKVSGLLSAIQLAEGSIGLYQVLASLGPCTDFWNDIFTSTEGPGRIQRLKAASSLLKIASGGAGLLALGTSWTVGVGAFFGVVSIGAGLAATGVDLYIDYQQGGLSWLGLRPPSLYSPTKR
jgi:hypothetical protein